MKRVGVREFRDHATKYLAGDETIVVERHGKPIGMYTPVGPSGLQLHPDFGNREAALEAAARLEKTVQKILDETGMTEDEFADLFDLNKPLPDKLPGHPRRAAS